MRRKIIRRARRILRIKDCPFCKNSKEPDYKDTDNLNHFISDRGKILPRNVSGVCQKHQLRLTKSVKQARYIALLPFIVRPS
ncbi:30S ribosomal protein S18 [Candidatus Gottesmanbacteria bacterium RIFCSPLOWO2_02_FULL_42_29]|uniref:Small ribosomal subunit protein bS18 n=1 Tax=Candidatus Gottesmanbacteria bacterium RIFCSPLOWO2_01_FULL_42_22 TaxID=1798391 RepID=A0A1F6BH72_9BACT|nr:MAG: 30S ribosomal protein S18 [Candidatus Gottesmanbacteria bacterium RIFCSPHIGHO2_01_FULL_42_27]OGG20778.1 MAG: 30S ribosomal protein S18 [Candidatus Gottesmanbacteria bacterium RIFCSPHIGHO2_12_FULL_43_26]OGG35538.1 MAG: 30S ribosomal protein S18 [Candidatus Gottesmanbacteria bacterium RIFCSPLOWO2_12_FULL_42_10]OGG36228.1 MAG: 30S ribosomal protein S18 [Candidatus Gottesmanbacteria bacterium RIFCSPLOWO2_01_FULL_42_22]OGG36385.1 MAG: 30S ribosomal protein S18 [Candidatus Gottesmanbacteria b